MVIARVRSILPALWVLLLTSCGILHSGIPQPGEEFRAVWIATVANIDWPKSGTEPWSRQQQEFIELLDFYRDLNFNAVIVQVRTAGDALYPTALAPWSRYLTGREGRPPDTAEDPLAWMIEAAHSRGFQFHAWLNPYRATTSLDTTSLSESHDYYRHPEWMLPYGTKYYYNPGIPEVRDHLTAIIKEVVAAYPVDGIHFDDYFYPYKIQGEVLQDSLSYQTHAPPGQGLEAWRRSNVDALIGEVHKAIKAGKPWVQFGVSPFGVWRNRDMDARGSDTQAGQTTYDDLYADPLRWIQQGWLDYIVPQIYWSMEFAPASHRKLVAWWAANSEGTKLYIGNGAYKVRNNSDAAWNRKKELGKQVLLARKTAAVQGNVFFSAKSLLGQEDVIRYLKSRYYRVPALPPQTSAPASPPQKPPRLLAVSGETGYYRLELEPLEPESPWQYALIYAARRPARLLRKDPSLRILKVFLDNRNHLTLGKGLLEGKKHLGLTFLDRYGRESHPIMLHLGQTNQDDSKR